MPTKTIHEIKGIYFGIVRDERAEDAPGCVFCDGGMCECDGFKCDNADCYEQHWEKVDGIKELTLTEVEDGKGF